MAHAAQTQDDAIFGINVTPLVDIMLVLLIVFMIAARIDAAHAATVVGVELPRAQSGAEPAPPTLSVIIRSDGTLLVDGAPASPGELAARARVAAAGSARAQALVAADRAVRYQQVVAVVDVLRVAGVSRLALAVEGTP